MTAEVYPDPVAVKALRAGSSSELDPSDCGSDVAGTMPAMPMRATTVRFAESLWTLVEREAELEGVSAAQFIRDASVMRAAYAMGRRGDPEMEAALGRAPDDHG